MQTYKGKRIVWVTFSSTRDYGLPVHNEDPKFGWSRRRRTRRSRCGTSKEDAPDGAPVTESRALRLVDSAGNAVERSGTQRDAAEPLQDVADPVAVELEAVLALRRSGADPKALRRVLRRIEELLDE